MDRVFVIEATHDRCPNLLHIDSNWPLCVGAKPNFTSKSKLLCTYRSISLEKAMPRVSKDWLRVKRVNMKTKIYALPPIELLTFALNVQLASFTQFIHATCFAVTDFVVMVHIFHPIFQRIAYCNLNYRQVCLDDGIHFTILKCL